MKEKQKTVMKTMDYIEKHLSEDIKLDDIAKAAGYSKYHLNRIFTEFTGKTIHRYIKERRLTESAISLTSTDSNIIEIAQDAGYTSQQAYTLAFRQHYHCTPQVYRVLNQRTVLQNRVQMFRKLWGSHNWSVVCNSIRGGMAA